MPFCSLINSLSGCSVWKHIVCFISFMKNQNVFKKGEMGQTRERRDKTWGEMGQKMLSGFAGRTAPDSVVAAPEVPQQYQTGPNRGRQFS